MIISKQGKNQDQAITKPGKRNNKYLFPVGKSG